MSSNKRAKYKDEYESKEPAKEKKPAVDKEPALSSAPSTIQDKPVEDEGKFEEILVSIESFNVDRFKELIKDQGSELLNKVNGWGDSVLGDAISWNNTVIMDQLKDHYKDISKLHLEKGSSLYEDLEGAAIRTEIYKDKVIEFLEHFYTRDEVYELVRREIKDKAKDEYETKEQFKKEESASKNEAISSSLDPISQERLGAIQEPNSITPFLGDAPQDP